MNKFKAVCATQLWFQQSLGMQVWGVDEDGWLRYNFRLTSGPWKDEWDKSSKQNLSSLTAAPNPQGATSSLWAVASDGTLVSNGSWGATWSENWVTNPLPASAKLALICACEPSEKVGLQLFAVGSDHKRLLYYSNQSWAPWDKIFGNVTALTAANDPNGLTSLWLVDNGVLVSAAMNPDGRGWQSNWNKNPTPQKFTRICACKRGGGLGRALWGVGEKGELWWCYEPDPNSGNFNEWRNFPGPGQPVKSLCVARNDREVMLWALSQDDSVHNFTQTTSDHDWDNFTDESKWDAGGTRPPSNPSLLNDIAAVIGRGTDSKYRKVTYEVTSHNTFTLLDTPHLWNKSATAPKPIPACKKLLDQIAITISNARNVVDIMMMWEFAAKKTGLPSGDFQKALNQGFRSLVKSGSLPLVRILVGIPLGPWVISNDLHTWVKTVIERDGGPKINQVKFPILIGAGKEAPTSWNHSKIVAADGVRAVVGGHNFWSDQYLGATPVHDVSGLFEGSVVRAVHRFCDQFWHSSDWKNPLLAPGAWILKKGGFERYLGKGGLPFSYPGIGAGQGKGNTRMLALGRLGNGIVKEFTVATNASVSARIIALCRAKSKIRISQQSLYNSIEVGVKLTTGFDFYTLWAIIKAVQAGVKVEIVITNDVGLMEGGYQAFLQKVVDSLAALQIADRLGLFPRAVSLPKSREDIVAWASASLNPPAKDIPLVVSKLPLPTAAQSAQPLAELNANLKLAQLYYAPDINYWQVGSQRKNAANHAKVYIIDDTHFYVGSDNMYLSGSAPGLQEYGYLIEGQRETQDFIKNYWDELWENSKRHSVQIKFPTVNRRIALWTIQ